MLKGGGGGRAGVSDGSDGLEGRTGYGGKGNGGPSEQRVVHPIETDASACLSETRPNA